MNEDIRKALFILLHDQFDSPDLELNNSEETYFDYIVSGLIEKNENICPFKDYNCVECCKTSGTGCVHELTIDCNRGHEDIWREFILEVDK